MTRPGTILVLNGASSSGKTTLLKEIQAKFPEPFVDAGIDRFIWMLPGRYLDRPLWDDVLGLATRAGEVGNQLFHGMHQAIAALSRSGLSVVADHVLVEKHWWIECAELFKDLPAYLVAVRCPLGILEAREKQRKDRTLGQARAQFDRVHMFSEYDVELDTSKQSPEVCADLVRQRILSGGPPAAFRRLQEQFIRDLS